MTQYLYPNSILIFGRTLKREVLEGQGSGEAATPPVDLERGQGARGGHLGNPPVPWAYKRLPGTRYKVIELAGVLTVNLAPVKVMSANRTIWVNRAAP